MIIPIIIFTLFATVAIQKEVITPIMKRDRCLRRKEFKAYLNANTLIQVEKENFRGCDND